MQNPYEKRRIKGVRGSVPSHFESFNIYDRSDESVSIFVGALDKDVFDFGYEVHLKDGTHLKKIPGVGKGYFNKFMDANAYAAYAIKIAFSSRLSQAAVNAIDYHIKKITMPVLDLI